MQTLDRKHRRCELLHRLLRSMAGLGLCEGGSSRNVSRVQNDVFGDLYRRVYERESNDTHCEMPNSNGSCHRVACVRASSMRVILQRKRGVKDHCAHVCELCCACRQDDRGACVKRVRERVVASAQMHSSDIVSFTTSHSRALCR